MFLQPVGACCAGQCCTIKILCRNGWLHLYDRTPPSCVILPSGWSELSKLIANNYRSHGKPNILKWYKDSFKKCSLHVIVIITTLFHNRSCFKAVRGIGHMPLIYVQGGFIYSSQTAPCCKNSLWNISGLLPSVFSCSTLKNDTICSTVGQGFTQIIYL